MARGAVSQALALPAGRSLPTRHGGRRRAHSLRCPGTGLRGTPRSGGRQGQAGELGAPHPGPPDPSPRTAHLAGYVVADGNDGRVAQLQDAQDLAAHDGQRPPGHEGRPPQRALQEALGHWRGHGGQRSGRARGGRGRWHAWGVGRGWGRAYPGSVLAAGGPPRSSRAGSLPATKPTRARADRAGGLGCPAPLRPPRPSPRTESQHHHGRRLLSAQPGWGATPGDQHHKCLLGACLLRSQPYPRGARSHSRL